MNDVDKKALKEFAKSIGEGLKGVGTVVLNGVCTVTLAPYIIPTTVRRFAEASGKCCDTDFIHTYSVFLAFALTAFDVAAFNVSTAVFKDHPPGSSMPLETYLLFGIAPIATSVLSGIYEGYRYHKKKILTYVTPAVTSATPSPLETKAETPEIKPEAKSELTKPTATPKREIPNPWDVKIDPLENKVYGGAK